MTTKLIFQGSNLIITRIYMSSSFGFLNLLNMDFGVLIVIVVCALHPNLWALDSGVSTDCCVLSLLCADNRLGFRLWSFDWLLCFVVVVCT